MTQPFLLRMEGVNLSNVLSDTNQISVIRGSSLLLRQAVKDVHRKYTLNPVSVGASVGLFAGDLPEGETSASLRDKIASYLSMDKAYKHLTFVVDALLLDDDFQACREQLIGLNRLRQLQQVTLAIPDWNEAKRAAIACQWDGVRPAAHPLDRKPGLRDPDHVSKSVFTRFDYGSSARKRFYREELQDSGMEHRFTNDLQELADDDTQGNLHRKIALIYFDGNHFGQIQQQHCTDIPKQQAFDHYIQQQRRDFLRQLVEYAHDTPAFQTPDGDLRLEVLMWGGDEMLLVVPAWVGLDVLQLFYTTSQTWCFEGSALTHAGGIVFSQANTPIYRLRNLAEDLANGVKQQGRGNRFDYLILESMDFPAEPLDRLRDRQFGQLASQRSPLSPFPADSLQIVRSYLDEQQLPRSQLVPLAQTAIHAPANFVQQYARLQTVLGKNSLEQIQSGLQTLLGEQAETWLWVHLAELWDYLLPARALPQASEVRHA